MRKLKQLAWVLSIIILLLAGCKKESIPASDQKLRPTDFKLSQMIEDFRNHSQLKNGEKMSIDSTIWYLEATTNYTYGDGLKSTGKTETDSIFINLPIDSEQRTNVSDVWIIYNQMIDSILVHYQKLNDSEKQLIAVDVKVKEFTTANLALNVTTTFAVGVLPANHPCDFDNSASYMWWSGCFPYPGYVCPTDAAEEIEKRIIWCSAVPVGNYWFEEVEVKYVGGAEYPNPNWPGIPNYYEYLMFFNTSTKPNFHGLLSPEECNFYLNGTKWVIYTPVSQGGKRPAGKSFISVNVIGDALYPLGSSQYYHRANISYGILHISINPPNPL